MPVNVNIARRQNLCAQLVRMGCFPKNTLPGFRLEVDPSCALDLLVETMLDTLLTCAEEGLLNLHLAVDRHTRSLVEMPL